MYDLGFGNDMFVPLWANTNIQEPIVNSHRDGGYTLDKFADVGITEFEGVNGPDAPKTFIQKGTGRTVRWIDCEDLPAESELDNFEVTDWDIAEMRLNYQEDKYDAFKDKRDALIEEHKVFRNQMIAMLEKCPSKMELRSLINLAIKHDNRLNKLAEIPDHFNTFGEMPYRFFEAEERIEEQMRRRGLKVAKVGKFEKPVLFPAVMTRGEGKHKAFAVAQSKGDIRKYEEQGFALKEATPGS